jgi:hypothetical protein
MPSTRDLLQRFRPAGAPGAASATGVPADRADERAVELAPVFAALRATVEEAERIRRDARDEAQRRRERARDEVAAIVASARVDAESLRAQATAEARESLDVRLRDGGRAARRRAHEIEQEAARTRTADVAQVVVAVRDHVLRAQREEAPR